STSYDKNTHHSYYLPGEYRVVLRITDTEGNYQKSETLCTISNQGNLLPVARAQVTQPIYCYVNEPLDFSSVDSYDEDGEIVGVLWDFDDGETSMEPSVTHTFTKRDLYEVTLTVTDDADASQQDIIKCYVMNTPVVQIDGPFTKARGELITFSAMVVFDGFDEENQVEEYEWSLEGSFSKSYEENPSHIFNTEGTFPISVIITDSLGNEYRDTAEFTIVPAGLNILGYEISLDTLRDYSGWILGVIVALITIVGAGSGVIRNIVSHFSKSSEQDQFYAVFKKRLQDLNKTYEYEPDTLSSELLELKEDLLSSLKDKSITMSHYKMLDEEIDKILETTRK
ncbi:MAG: PKD domain-containing protein, partial [Candidatus Bathyarchaeota archaeon]|nr:PKD domain-containing protein [Candidatus Bathyarchaeota archaeon]